MGEGWSSAATSPYERDQGIEPDPTRHADDLVALEGILDSIRPAEDAG